MMEEEKKRGSPCSWIAVVFGVLAFGPVGVPMGMGLLRLAVRAMREDLSLVVPFGCLVAPLLLIGTLGFMAWRRAGVRRAMAIMLGIWVMLPLGAVLEFFAPFEDGVREAMVAGLFYLGPPLGLASVVFSAIAHVRREPMRRVSLLPGVYGACLVVFFGALWALMLLGIVKV